MLPITVVYNIVMFALDIFVLRSHRKPPWRALAIVWVVALVLAIVLGMGRFGAMGLFAYGFFLHGVVVLLGSAWRGAKWTLFPAVFLVGTAVFAFGIEPFRLEVTPLRIETDELEGTVRVLLISDLQTDRIGDFERRVLERAMAESPDLILMSGDYIQVHDPAERRAVRSELRAALRDVDFQAPLGIVAVGGNTDSPDWPSIFEGFPVTVVRKTTSLDLGELTVTALELWQSFDPDAVVPDADGFHIVVGHSPDFALGDVSADLLLAGHTHGGQVQLPWIGPLLTLSRVPRGWASGVTKVDEDTTLVVSRGIGMERGRAPRLRFLCRPELVVIDLVGRRKD